MGCGLRADPETRHTRGQDARRQHERAAREPVHAMKSAFIPFDQRLAIIDEVIKPRFAALMGHSE
ncbi:hypothetical protein BN9982_770020 [Mycobacterium tuberculosis]|nr:hypothetical protein BN9982_770020 [Mycobacterium tuberculosis]